VLYGNRAVPIVAWSDLVITSYLTLGVVGTPLGEGIAPNIVVVRMPANEKSNAVALPLAVAQTPTPAQPTPTPGTDPGTAPGTTTPAASELQFLNDALLVERLAAAFFNANATKPYLTVGVTNPAPEPAPGTAGALQDTSGGTTLSATLSGGEETPPVTTSATGTATFTFNEDRTQLAYDVRVSGLSGSATGMHIHRGARGVAGDIVYTLTNPDANGVATGSVAVNAPDVDPLLQGAFYLNVHTAANPNGEIRGQVVAQQEPGPTPGTPPGATPGTSPTTNLDALRGIVDEIRQHHNEHVTTLEQRLGTNAQQAPTFQNLDAPTLQQFLTMAQTIEDFAVSAHQGSILTALGIPFPTTPGDPQPGTTQPGSTTPAAGSIPQAAIDLVLAIALDDARHAGAIRAYRKTVSTADGGDPNLTLTEDGGALNVARNRDQVLAFIQTYLASGTAPAPNPAPGTGNGTAPSPGTPPGNAPNPGANQPAGATPPAAY
jgi:hypothetical protein